LLQALQENIVIIAKYRAKIAALEQELRNLRGGCDLEPPAVEPEGAAGAAAAGGAQQQQQQQQQGAAAEPMQVDPAAGAAAGGGDAAGGVWL
jgi:hypothetical protein